MADRSQRRRHWLLGALDRLFRGLAAKPRDAPPEAKTCDERRSLFDADWYLATYPDIQGMDPFEHFVGHGESEGRDPSATFSVPFYRRTYMAGEAQDTSPTDHFLRVGRGLGYDPNPPKIDEYALHLLAQEQSFILEAPELLRHVEVMTVRPRFLVVVDDDKDVRTATEGRLGNQIYPDWALCTPDDVARVAREASGHPWCLVWLGAGDVLHASALYCFASAINADPAVDIVYADEDELDAAGHRRKPFYKPDWSADYLESCNYIGSAACVRGPLAEAVLPDSLGPYDFLLRATERALRVKHVRRVLVHRSRGLDAPKTPAEIAGETAALQGRLARTGRVGTVTALEPGFGCYDVKPELRATPLVSVVIPTAGRIVEVGGRTIDLIFNCLQTIEDRSSYKNLEFIVVDNGDIDAARMQALHDRGVRTITYDEPTVNVARKLNIGAAAARGDFLLLLNDDIEPLTTDWIERLLEQFGKPNVGVVGAKLVFPDMTIQHAGVILRHGTPDHSRMRFPRDDDGYMFSTCAVRNCIAVTGAVMLVRTSVFRQVGGYTERLAIVYNDVDFCLKLRERGYRAVYTPRAELLHHESLSRERIVDQAERDYFSERWATIATDPFYNEENLTLLPATYEFHANGRPIG